MLLMCMKYYLYNTFHDIKGHIARHQERSCKDDLSITFTVLEWLSFQTFQYLRGIFSRVDITESENRVAHLKSSFLVRALNPTIPTCK